MPGGWGQDPLTHSKGGGGHKAGPSRHAKWGQDPLAGHALTAGGHKPHHGGGNIFGNALKDAESTITGIVPGIVATAEHPIRTAKAMGHEYGQYYGPLFHGHVGQFAHNVKEHPLQLGLDAAAAATALFSAGGSIAARAGIEPTLAARALEVAAPSGEMIPTRLGSRNLLTLSRQKLVNKGVNALPRKTPIIGASARYARVVARQGDEVNSLLNGAIRPTELFNRLKKHEKAAVHLRLQGITPSEYAAGFEGAADPKVVEAFLKPNRRMKAAEKSYRDFSPAYTAHMVKHLNLDEEQALHRQYAPLLNARGWKHTKGNITKLSKEFQGREPVYVPHHAAEPDYMKVSTGGARASIRNRPQKIDRMKQYGGKLQEAGLLDFNRPPTADIPKIVKYSQRKIQGEYVLRHSKIVDRKEVQAMVNGVGEKAQGIKWVPLKATVGAKGVDYTETALKDENWLTTNDPEEWLTSRKGKAVHMIPDADAKLLQGAGRVPDGTLSKFLYNKPTHMWKKLVLGLRPAYAVNIITSQHILGALQAADKGEGLRAYINHVAPGMREGKFTDETIQHVWPSQAHGAGTFSSTAGGTLEEAIGEVGKGGRVLASRASQGVMPAVMRVEAWLRKLMLEGWSKAELKNDPLMQQYLRSYGGNWNEAIREYADAARSGNQHAKAMLDEIERRVDHSQGNYRHYSPAEQKLRQIIPFYGWDKHIVQSTYRLVAERPHVVAAGAALGRQGDVITKKEFGELPSYLQGVVALPGLPKFMGPAAGFKPTLQPRAAEPFNQVADLLRIPRMVTGHAGTQTEELSLLNPLFQAAIQSATGRNIVTGGTLKGRFTSPLLSPLRVALELPQARMIEEAFGKHPTGISKHPTYKSDLQTQLSAYFGIPVKKLDVKQAHKIAKMQFKPPR